MDKGRLSPLQRPMKTIDTIEPIPALKFIMQNQHSDQMPAGPPVTGTHPGPNPDPGEVDLGDGLTLVSGFN